MLYCELPLVPSIIARMVANETYKGQELSVQIRNSAIIERIEKARQEMSPNQIEQFIQLCDISCKEAYSNKSDWFISCVNNDKGGRDQLYNWIRHWLVKFLLHSSK